jgi:3',5'-nucleoside bisphosphate phosphatase
MIDLQNHTVASDGDLTAEQLVDLAIEKNLTAIAITDHDSVDSVQKAIEYSKGRGIEIIPGIEISCDDPLMGTDKIDVLGLFIDVKNNEIIKLVKHINEVREEHKKKIIGKIKSLGYDIDYDEVRQTAEGTFGRPHIARYLVKKYPKEFSSVNDVFSNLIGQGKKAFVNIEGRVSIKACIGIIHRAGGIAILAHPGIYPQNDSVRLIDYFIENGGDGIETYYPYHIICPKYKIDKKGNENLIEFYKGIVKSKKILESGGNDHHDNERPTIGEVEIPESILDNLKKNLKSRQ